MHSSNSLVVKGSAALRSMRTLRSRSAPVGLVPHLVERVGLELGHQHLGGGGDGGVARLLAAADEGHLAEALALVHGVEELAAARHRRLALGEEEEALARLLFLDERVALLV